MITERIVLNERGATLDTYILNASKEMPNMLERPAVLVIPGGGYKFVSDREAEPIAMAFLAEGYNAFVLTYSVGKGKAKFPNPLEEAEAAMKLIRANADKWHVKPDKIAAIGFSAGGHLAAALGTMGCERPNALLLGYPCILDSIGSILAEPIPSLEKMVTAETPPTFIFSSSVDRSVPIENSLKFAEALNDVGVNYEMHIFGEGGHGFSLANEVVCSNEESRAINKMASRWFKMCIDWLKKTQKF